MDVYKKLKTNKKNRSTRRVLLFFCINRILHLCDISRKLVEDDVESVCAGIGITD